jgi:predicted transcriptional regulator
MTPDPVTVPPQVLIQTLVDEHIFTQGMRAVGITSGGRLVGLITLHDVRQVPRQHWGEVHVGEVMVPLERPHVVRPGQSLNDVLPLMAQWDVNQLPVVQDGQLVGMLSRDRVVHFIEVRRSLGVGQTPREPRSPWPPQGWQPPQSPQPPAETAAPPADTGRLPHAS